MKKIKSKRIDRNIELLYEIGSFRYMQRLWKRFLNPDFQNNTEHTFRVAWIALVLAGMEKKGNHEKLLKMALVHDLPESRCGDVDYIARQYTKRDEELGAEDIFAGTDLADEFIGLWKEYEKRECIEAKLVKDADNLDVEFELLEQTARGHRLLNEWKSMRRKNVYPKLFTKSAKELWDTIDVSNPYDWHVKGRNRHTSGDWKTKR